MVGALLVGATNWQGLFIVFFYSFPSFSDCYNDNNLMVIISLEQRNADCEV